MDIIPQPLRINKVSFWPLFLSLILFLSAGGCAGPPRESRPIEKIVRERVAKTNFNNEYLVLLLIKEGILETDFYDSDYVYFNGGIKDENDLINRLHQAGVGNTGSIVNILLGSQKTAPKPLPDNIKEIKKLLVKGNAYSDLGHFKKALELYMEAFEKYQSPDAAYNIAVTLETNLNRPKEAMPYYLKFIMLEKDGDDVVQAKRWLNALQKQFRQDQELSLIFKREKPAKKDLKMLLDSRPVLDGSNLADSELKEVKRALEEGAKAYAKNDYAKAIKEYKKVLKLYDNPDACYNLGVIYDKKLEQYEESLFFYRRYLKIEPSLSPNAEVPQAIKRLQKMMEELN